MKKTLCYFSLLLMSVAFTISCAGDADDRIPVEPLSDLEVEEISAAWLSEHFGVDPSHEILVDLISRYDGLPLVRVHLSGSGPQRVTTHEEAGGIAVNLSLGASYDSVCLYDSGGRRLNEKPYPPYTTNIRFHSLTMAYLYGLMSRDDAIDARDRLIDMGLALPVEQFPLPLSVDEFSAINLKYDELYGRESGSPLVMEVVGRFNGMPMVHVNEPWRGSHEGDHVEIGGVGFDYIHSGTLVLLYDGAGFRGIQEAYDAGLLNQEDMLTVKENLIRLRLAREGW